MDPEKYWSDIHTSLDSLLRHGFCRLPTLASLDLDKYSEQISEEANDGTWSSLVDSHRKFLSVLAIDKYLAPKLYEIAQTSFGFKGNLSDQYHIARRVNVGDHKESYRAHFDSHLFTLVMPLKIPRATRDGSQGELIYLPYARKMPHHEFINTLEKVLWKKFASKRGVERLGAYAELRTADFLDYRPLLFIGNTTFHTNKPVSADCSHYRLSLLSHFFDPSPRYGVGSLLRRIRRR